MSLEKFKEGPWKLSHHVYESSVFSVRPAPENATAEVLVAAAYRTCGFEGHPEKQVPAAGGKFLRDSQKAKRPLGTSVSNDTWLTVLQGTLESPKRPKQSSRRFLQLCPMVPDCALYSGSARLTGNSWDPGQLLSRMILVGSHSREDAEQVWRELFTALAVGSDDDIWARWLQEEFDARRQLQNSFAFRQLLSEPGVHDLTSKVPAKQFVRDLRAIIAAKSRMTRRQWISLFEAILRLGSVSHVLWLCEVNDRLWRTAREIISGKAAPAAEEVNSLIVESRGKALIYGKPAAPIVRNFASRYLESRLGLNTLLWNLDDWKTAIAPIDSVRGLWAFLKLVESNRDRFHQGKVVEQFEELVDSQPSTVACKKGIGSNIVEFCRYTLGQRETLDDNLRGYDQGYLLKKKAEYRAAPWVVSLGPVALLALVHSCLNEVAGPRSVQRLCEHLAQYGLDVDRDDVAQSDLGRNLRMLGLVLDSPDAESGMLLIPPFEAGVTGAATR